MTSKSKLALLISFAAALLAGPVPADAAQFKQAKHLGSYSGATVAPYAATRTVIPAGRIYLLEDRAFANSNSDVDFQDRFRIGY